MIKNILFSLIFVCLMFAVSLSMFGVTHVELGAPFMSFLQQTNRLLNDFKIAIPSIPLIPLMEQTNFFMAILNVLVSFVNGLVNLINFIITIVNIIIQLLQFVFILLNNFITMRDDLIANASSSSSIV